MVANSLKKEENEDTTIKENKTEKSRKKRKKKVRIRVFPIWLRIIVVLLLFAASLAIGLMVGYGVIGDKSPADVFDKATWQHIIDFIKKE